MSQTNVTKGFPRQRLSYKKKTRSWRTKNVDQGDGLSLYNNSGVRKTIQNRLSNTMLYMGVTNSVEMQMALNPNSLSEDLVPTRVPHHPIMAPKIDVLIGEELNRGFDYSFVSTSPDAITAKAEEQKSQIMQALAEAVQSENLSPKDMEAQAKKIEKYMRYSFKDMREHAVNQLMKYYYEEQDFDGKFNDGFKDVLLNGEEIYSCEIVGGEPVLEKLNGLKVRALRTGGSNRIEDSDMIIIEDHWAAGRIIDTFYEELSPKDIDYITGYTSGGQADDNYTDDYNNPLLFTNGFDDNRELFDSYQAIADINGHMFSSNLTNEDGDIRVIRVLWKSQKCIYKVKYYDEITGDTLYKHASEEYIPDEEAGEEVTKLWINEWWEGTKIGKDLYLNMRPRQVQYSSLSNPSKCYPGIVGQVYNTNQGRPVSLVDKMKGYQYLYDATWFRLNKAIARNLGKILMLDAAIVPNGWEPEKWFKYATSMGLGMVDGFKEGNIGAAQGKLAGNLNGSSSTKVLDLETGNYIQQHVGMLEFIKNEMGEIAGISRQREGQVSNRESVGGVERAVTQSSHITEYWFSVHDQVKKRVLATFLETAKFALKGNNKKINYIADDLTKKVLNIEGDLINESEYGIVATDSRSMKKIKEVSETMAQAFMQNGGKFSTVLDIFNSPSLADMRKKIEGAEDEAAEREQEAQKAQQEANQQALMAEEAKLEREDINKSKDRMLKKYEIDNKALLEREKMDSAENAKLNEAEYKQADISIKEQKNQDDKLAELRRLQAEIEMNDKNNASKEKIANNKSVTNKTN